MGVGAGVGTGARAGALACGARTGAGAVWGDAGACATGSGVISAAILLDLYMPSAGGYPDVTSTLWSISSAEDVP
ncbi:MAG TPA: hypothetical protein EYN91_14050 [Candidatus Melainabacteria bacterium]|nr:hypothetical protein [Candidatus Melainabacteria bacterium]HIN65349.1 hypothetical protein [Candidatus Obscuribacterales bacterium]